MAEVPEMEKALNNRILGIWTLKLCELAGGITLLVYAVLGPGFLAGRSFGNLECCLHVMDDYWWWDDLIDGIALIGFTLISFACGILVFIVGWRLNSSWDLIPMKQDLLLIISYLLRGFAGVLIIAIICEFILAFFPGHVPIVTLEIVSGSSVIATTARMLFCLFCLGILYTLRLPFVQKHIRELAGI